MNVPVKIHSFAKGSSQGEGGYARRTEGCEFIPACRPFPHLSGNASGTAPTHPLCRSRRVPGPSPSAGLLSLLRGQTAAALAAPSRSSPRSNPPSRSEGHRSRDRRRGRDHHAGRDRCRRPLSALISSMASLSGIRKKRMAPPYTRSATSSGVNTGSTPLYPPSEITGSSVFRMIGDEAFGQDPLERLLQSVACGSFTPMNAS